MEQKCDGKVEVWARCCGFFRPISQFNLGKKEEYKDRVEYTALGLTKDKDI
jgi:anaerobic ribonucleoside-triphosphate reductase